MKGVYTEREYAEIGRRIVDRCGTNWFGVDYDEHGGEHFSPGWTVTIEGICVLQYAGNLLDALRSAERSWMESQTEAAVEV